MEKIARFVVLALVITGVFVVAWNILNFLFFQRFGCRYYGVNYWTVAFAPVAGFTVLAPAALGCSHGAPVLGILGSVALLVVLVAILRVEAEKNGPGYA
jgi:O-antigen/teichoic acid export membrane protein